MSKIEYATKSWNPITGCSPISAGCDNCWARRMAKRLAGRCGYDATEPFRVTLRPERIADPLRWRRSQRVAVCFMGDLYHADVPGWFLGCVWDVMATARRHTFLVLTKRPDRLAKHTARWWPQGREHICLGTSIENQAAADERLPWLMECRAAVRYVSLEPLLGRVDLRLKRWPVDWVIVGGESGLGARPMNPDWVRDIRDQCQAAGVPLWFKQWGEWVPFGDACGGPIYARCSGHPRFEHDLLLADGRSVHLNHGSSEHIDSSSLYRVGKKAAGRMLDGREWNEMPAQTQESTR